jgi:uncharacterized membrane protein
MGSRDPGFDLHAASLIPFARKMIEGVHLPLCFLAALGLVWLLDSVGGNRVLKRALASAAVLLISVSSLQFVAWCLDNARDNNVSRQAVLMPPLYLPTQATEAFQFLNSLPDNRNQAVLCFPLWGNYVPRFSGFPVYAGHFDETLHFPRKLAEMRRFYSGSMDAAQQLAWLRANRIGYVIVGPYERQAFGARDLPAPFQRVWDKDNLVLYKVR